MDPFVAEISVFGCNFAPRGWAQCRGQLLPIAQNTALFSIIGTTYGGDGRTTTALPNFEGRLPMHAGRGPGLTTRALGTRVGVETVTLIESQIPSHTHTYFAGSGDIDGSSPVNNTYPNGNYYADTANQTLNSQSMTSTGGGQSHYNLSPYLSLNICIALEGTYPSRS